MDVCKPLVYAVCPRLQLRGCEALLKAGLLCTSPVPTPLPRFLGPPDRPLETPATVPRPQAQNAVRVISSVGSFYAPVPNGSLPRSPVTTSAA